MRAKLSILPLLFFGCATTYSSLPKLDFKEIPYAGPSGKVWAEKTLDLAGVAELYALADTPKVTYVELNPEGEHTVVFLHGLGSYLKFWRYQLDEFADDGWHVVAIDMVGYGKSDKPASFPYTMESMGDVVREVLKSANIERPILIGHSMGGHIALSYAIRFPNDLTALVLTAPAGFEHFSRNEQAWMKSVLTVGAIKGATEEGIWGSIRRNNFYRWTPDYEWLVEERVRLAQSPEFDAYAYANVRSVHGLTETDFVRDNLENIKVPTLIVHGDRDRLIPNPFLHGGSSKELMSWAHERIAGSSLVTLDACGHTVQIDCHDDYNRTVKSFLDPLRHTASR
jgi:pimeloyl-ACP methyl ester carboxylesterase